jgi:hypothetical protein
VGVGGAKATGGMAATGGTPAIMSCPGLPYVAGASGAAAGGSCASVGITVEPPPVDIFLMLDRSLSMSYLIQNTTLQRWDVLQQGVSRFISDPAVLTKAPRVGLGFFSATATTSDPTGCDPNSYVQPNTEIESIATGGPKVLQAVADEYPLLGGPTPTLPALWGALRHAQAWQKGTLRMTVAVLVTDGYATACDTDMSHAAQVAQEYFQGTVGTYNDVGAPAIRSYVIGLAVDRFNLDAIAQAGGTGSATIVDNVGAVDQMVTALTAIAKGTIAPTSCNVNYPTPPAGYSLDPAKLRLIYKPNLVFGISQEIPLVASGADCSGPNGGFYYDSPAAPTTVSLSPCSCANSGAGSLEFRLGCSR